MVVDDAMRVVALLPDFAGGSFAYGEGESAFEELSAAFDGQVRRGRE